MSLQQMSERVLYFPGANNIGVVALPDGGAIIIDSGLDKDVARKLRKALDEVGLSLRAIINTHHHADHIGGNAYLVRNIAGVQVYAPPLEAALIEHPLLEPTYLNYGASPARALRTRWLMAQGTRVHHLIGDDAEAIMEGRALPPLEVQGVRFEVLPLPGHSAAQIGLVVDGVCFAADGYFGRSVVAKHGLLYAHDIAAQLASFERLAARQDDWFLPGHGELSSRAEVGSVLEANRQAVAQAVELVQAALAEPGDLATVAARVLETMPGQAGEQAEAETAPAAPGMTSMTIPQYAIFASGIAAYLSYLEQQGQARLELAAGRLLWHRLSPTS